MNEFYSESLSFATNILSCVCAIAHFLLVVTFPIEAPSLLCFLGVLLLAHIMRTILIHKGGVVLWWWTVIIVILFWCWCFFLPVVWVWISRLAVLHVLGGCYWLGIWWALVFAESLPSCNAWSQVWILAAQHFLMKLLFLFLLPTLLFSLGLLFFTLSPS